MNTLLAILKKHGWTFLKYATVGATGTIIDVAGFTLLVEKTGLGATNTKRIIAAGVSFIAAVINNYVFNRIWTFKSHDREISNEFLKFFIVSIIGLALNVFFLTVFSNLFVQLLQVSTLEALPAWANAGSKLGASAVVLIYNFLANRFWTFKEA